ncbi:hypothetical protein METH_10615 [Leisingera methylohalidivorans DSM 14336]|uniref:Uncharacterized protein n=1 Tax=Leisingera methylohalidivorans DSM 14336 TaxID=999552 RepID=V9W097_9RHOB|nr:hypothetical protein METH_10615 [Leisingera methylohalidivorans DSM 14336]
MALARACAGFKPIPTCIYCLPRHAYASREAAALDRRLAAISELCFNLDMTGCKRISRFKD